MRYEISVYKVQMERVREGIKKVGAGNDDSVHIPLVEAKTAFNKAFITLVKAHGEFKQVCDDMGLEAEKEVKKFEPAIIFGTDLNQDFTKFRDEASVMISKQEELRNKSQQAATPTARAAATPTPIKLAKADAISFSGQSRDFPRFKYSMMLSFPNEMIKKSVYVSSKLYRNNTSIC